MNAMNDEKLSQHEQAMLSTIRMSCDKLVTFRDVGKQVIDSLEKRIPQLDLVGYWEVIPNTRTPLKVTLEFFGLTIEVIAEVSTKESAECGEIRAFLISGTGAKTTYTDIETKTSFTFDDTGNIGQRYTIKEFPIPFITELTLALLQKNFAILA